MLVDTQSNELVETTHLIKKLKASNISSIAIKALTSREIECLCFWLNGYSAKQIAVRFGISYRTVETHIRNVSLKFNCSKRIEIFRKAQSLQIEHLIDKLFYTLINNNNK